MKLDLHVHTDCSDGDEDWKTVLQKAEAFGLEYLSITDHNSVDVYFQIKEPKKYFHGKIITGTELRCLFGGQIIEFLGYEIDAKKMKELIASVYPPEEEVKNIQFKSFHEALIKNGIKFDPDVYETWDRVKHVYPVRHLHLNMKKFPQNQAILNDEDAWSDCSVLYRKHLTNSKSRFYGDESCYIPSASKICNIIRQTGGKIFVAHPFMYGNNAKDILKKIIKECDIDGVECFYTTFTKNESKYLVDFCKENNLLISAGSDYHGVWRKGFNLGMDKHLFGELITWCGKI